MDGRQEAEARPTDSDLLDPNDPETAVRIRQKVLEYLHRAGGGHYGSCASCIDILLALCGSRPLAWGGRTGDRILLSKGHASMTLYAVLSLTGPEPLPLATFGAFGSRLQGHPDRSKLPFLDFSFGSLGQGVSVGVGLALGVGDLGHFVWVVLGDGECQEGMVWEAALLAGRYRVGNLRVIVDANGEQECGWAHDPTLEQLPLPADLAKWRAFGWRADEIDGHNVEAISQWIRHQVASPVDAPSVLIARTRKSLGTSVHLSRFRRHHTTLTANEFRSLRDELRLAADGQDRSTVPSCDEEDRT